MLSIRLLSLIVSPSNDLSLSRPRSLSGRSVPRPVPTTPPASPGPSTTRPARCSACSLRTVASSSTTPSREWQPRGFSQATTSAGTPTAPLFSPEMSPLWSQSIFTGWWRSIFTQPITVVDTGNYNTVINQSHKQHIHLYNI